MAGKPGRSGRRKGSISYTRNPVALAGHHLNVLIEMWLGGVPIRIGEGWLAPPATNPMVMAEVPLQVRRALGVAAITHLMRVTPHVVKAPLDLDAVLEWSRRHPPRPTLRPGQRLARQLAGSKGGKAKQRNALRLARQRAGRTGGKAKQRNAAK